MNKYLQYLDIWKQSKSQIFQSENFNVSVSETNDTNKKSRYIDIESSDLLGRATLWESGELELAALNKHSGNDEIFKSCLITRESQLDDELNWLLSEIATYENN